MEQEVKLYRSLLVIPASDSHALLKAASHPADLIAFDLEAGVAPEEKDTAREALRTLRQRGWPEASRSLVRINQLSTKWGTEDLMAAIAMRADGIILPKTERAEEIQDVLNGPRDSDATEALKLWLMIETPEGLLRLNGILDAVGTDRDRIAGLIPGADTDRHPQSPDHQRSMTVLAAKARGLAALDGPYNDFRDEAGFAAEAESARAAGFDGKCLTHPEQIVAANRCFSPSQEEVQRARELIAAFSLPENRGKDIISHNGKMAEISHLRQAQRCLALDRTIRKRTI